MSILNRNKLKILHQAWPPNVILTTKALQEHGISNQLIQKYSSSGWLKRIGSGAYVRQSDQPNWQGALYAIQQELKKPIHIGGLTALEIHGLGHYLNPSIEKTQYLYNTTITKHKLPGWLNKYFNENKIFQYTQCHIFDEELGLKSQQIEGIELVISEPERAILETLYFVPKQFSVEHVGQLIENLQTIRPDKMQKLLETCRHILIKRLFLCLADLQQIPALKHLDIKHINLGTGERTISPGGKYFPKYKLTMPYHDPNDLDGNINV